MGINVLSLFDGLSGGQIALDKLGIKVDNYFASEVDKYAIQVAKCNYPNTIHLGDVRDIKADDVDNHVYTFLGHKIDLLIGGSPCQDLSFAGRGKGLDGERSGLFFEYVRLLNELKPKYFLLENVKMKKENMDIITKFLGVEPVAINSALFSAQNRQRLYWTNIPIDTNIEDRGIVLKDIIEDSFMTDREKAHCIDANYWKGGNLKSYFTKHRRQLVFNKCIQVGEADVNGHDILKRVYSTEGKAPTLNTMGGGNREPKIVTDEGLKWRKLTCLECERLQTVPDMYTQFGIDVDSKDYDNTLHNHLQRKKISNTQRYKMLGNGFNVDTVAHILKNMEV